jgi:hypothetical protein
MIVRKKPLEENRGSKHPSKTRTFRGRRIETMAEKIILTLAPVAGTGAGNDNPLQLASIAERVVTCCNAGADLVHLHAREEQDYRWGIPYCLPSALLAGRRMSRNKPF